MTPWGPLCLHLVKARTPPVSAQAMSPSSTKAGTSPRLRQRGPHTTPPAVPGLCARVCIHTNATLSSVLPTLASTSRYQAPSSPRASVLTPGFSGSDSHVQVSEFLAFVTTQVKPNVLLIALGMHKHLGMRLQVQGTDPRSTAASQSAANTSEVLGSTVKMALLGLPAGAGSRGVEHPEDKPRSSEQQDVLPGGAARPACSARAGQGTFPVQMFWAASDERQ